MREDSQLRREMLEEGTKFEEVFGQLLQRALYRRKVLEFGELLNLSPSHCNITGITGDKLGRYSHTALISKGYP